MEGNFPSVPRFPPRFPKATPHPTAGGSPSDTWVTIDCEEQWPFDFALFGAQGKQGKRVAPRGSGETSS